MHKPQPRALGAIVKPLASMVFLALAAAAPPAQAGYTTLALPSLNLDVRTLTDGAAYVPLFPGTHTYNGTPFDLATDASGNTAFARGVLDISVGVFGVTQAYTIINSAFGAFGSNNGSIEFFGSSSYYKVDLIQGVNLRDHFDSVFNNIIDGVNAIEAFNIGPGRARLDEQIYNLPAAFASETLTSIRFTGLDLGGAGIPFIVAATVSVPDPAGVPVPSGPALVALGLLAAGALRRTRVTLRKDSSLAGPCGRAAVGRSHPGGQAGTR